MTPSTGGRAAACAALCGLIATGCASGPKPETRPPPAPTAAVAAPDPTPHFTALPGLEWHERLRRVFELLDGGQPGQARTEAEQVLREQPDNALAKSAIQQIDGDARLQLGDQNYSYKIRPGETLMSLAERYLGNRYLFYALAKYNNIDAPGLARAGETILIPGTPPPPPPPPPPKRKPEPAPRSGSVSAPAHAAPEEPPKKPPAAAPTRDPGRANALRSQGLVQMNKGAINQAVTLLRQAAQLDPGNAAIGTELARAVRIQGATH